MNRLVVDAVLRTFASGSGGYFEKRKGKKILFGGEMMGADLYLRSITDKARAEYGRRFQEACRERDLFAFGTPEWNAKQNEVNELFDKMYPDDGYFRDAYNDSNLLWQLGLSWWKDILPMLDKRNYLPIRQAERFLKMLLERELPLSLDDDARKYFQNKKERLTSLLKRSIEMREKIYCSL